MKPCSLFREVPVWTPFQHILQDIDGSNWAFISSASFQVVLQSAFGLFFCFQSLLSHLVTKFVLFIYSSTDLNEIMLCLIWQSHSSYFIPSLYTETKASVDCDQYVESSA
jgi:hypothetical protein